MEINIQSLHFKANDALEAYVQKKAERLTRLEDRILRSDICLKLDKSSKLNNKVCEIRLSVAGKDLFAKRQCKSFEEAANEAVEALQQQLKKRKTRMNKGRTL